MLKVTTWVRWYESCYEQISYLENAECPDEIMDDPLQFKKWLKVQRNKEEKRIENKH